MKMIVSQGYPLWVAYRDGEAVSGPYLVVMWDVKDGDHVPAAINPENGRDHGTPHYGLTGMDAVARAAAAILAAKIVAARS